MNRRELTLTWNTKTAALAITPSVAALMREEPVRLLLVTERDLTDTPAVTATLKIAGNFDGAPLWVGTGFTRVAYCHWSADVLFSSPAINTALGANTDPTDDVTAVPAVLQLRLAESGVLTAKSAWLPLNLQNDYSRADDLTPAALPDADGWLDARAPRIDKTLALTDPQKTNFFGNTGAAKNADLTAEASTARAAEGANAAAIAAEATARANAVTTLQTSLAGKVATALLGANNGVATLDSGGKVPAGQLPSYVDDVLEYVNLAGFPGTGETGKIYTAKDTNKIYRWSGSAYVLLDPMTIPNASDVPNDSGAPGATVKEALDQLAALLTSVLTMRAAGVTKIVPPAPATLTIDCAQLAGSLNASPGAIGFTVTIGSDSTITQPVLFQKRYGSDGGSGYAGGLVYVNYNQASGEDGSYDTFADNGVTLAANFVAALAAITTPPATGVATGDQLVLSSPTAGAAARLNVSESSGGYWPSANGSTSGSDEVGTRESELLAGSPGKIPRVFAPEVLAYEGDNWTGFIGIFAKSLDGMTYRGPLWSINAPTGGGFFTLSVGVTNTGIYVAQAGDSLVVATCDASGTLMDEATGTGAVVRALAFHE